MLLHNNSSGLTTIITGVYGSTNPSLKKDLWAVLIDSSSTTLPWCFIGDFNATLSHADKLSIRQPILSSLKAIQTTVMQAGLHNTQFAGNRLWSKSTYGNLTQNIKAAEEKVLHCQLLLDSDLSDLSRDTLQSAKSELHESLSAQEIHWKQRFRINWLKESDQNTKFFHLSAKARSSFNSIHQISVNGSITEDQAKIQAHDVDFFSNLFKPRDSQPSPSLFQINSPKVSALDNSFLTSIPFSDEIKAAVFSLKKNSSPGPDGFNGAFFTATWSIICQTISSAVQHFFLSRRIHRASNTFFLALIPKSKSPSSFSDFRPISLLNFTYKFLSNSLHQALHNYS
ncbi:hypothetical protein AAC387_Pa08g1163 [Persea americana]